MKNCLRIFGLTLFFFGTWLSIVYAYNWNIKTLDYWGDVGLGNSLVLDHNDLPHIAYTADDYLRSGSYYLKYTYWDGKKWHIQFVDHYIDMTGAAKFLPSLALDSSGKPCISYNEGYMESVDGDVEPNTKLKYATWNGSTWQRVTIADEGGSPSLVLDKHGNPHISYCRVHYFVSGRYILSHRDLMYTYWDGQKWQTQTVDIGGAKGGGNQLFST